MAHSVSHAKDSAVINAAHANMNEMMVFIDLLFSSFPLCGFFEQSPDKNETFALNPRGGGRVRSRLIVADKN